MEDKKNMKHKIFSASLVALASIAVVSCDDYNDQFNIDKTITDVRTTTITLASGDYATIAGNETNKAIAAQLDQEQGTGTAYADALAAVGTNGYFTTMASPEDYVPAFLAASNDYRLADVGSRFTVNVNYYKEPSGYLAELTGISSYDFGYYDYETAWGSNKASYLTPSTLSKIPEILATANPDAEAGDLMVVNYAYSGIEPGEGGNAATEAAAYRVAPKADENYTPVSTVIADTEGGSYTVKGTVIATYSRGFLLSDGTGSILVYLNGMPNNSIGDVVSVSGTTSSYSGLMQFPATSVVTMLERADEFSYPTPTTMTGADLDAYVAAPEVKYVSYTGTLSISGYYYNVTVDGAEASTGSIQYPLSGLVDSSLDGQQVTVTGYLIGVSGGKYTNTMATSVTLAGSEPEYTPVGLLQYAAAGNYSARGVVAATYDRGFLMTDGSGYILVYQSGTGCVAGDIVTVSGTTSQYGGFAQFGSDATVIKGDAGEYTLPTPRVLDGAAADAFIAAPYIGYVSYQGKLTIDGNYYNIEFDGASTAIGSLSYPAEGMVDPSLNGRTVNVAGFAIGVSSGKFLNTMVTSVEGVGGITSESNTSVLYAFDGEAWNEYATDAASVVALAPSVYAQYGSDAIDGDAIDGVAAAYLPQQLPYAQDGALAAVVYNNGDEFAVKEYTFTTGAWIPTPEYEVQQFIFENKADGWSADMSTYLNESFLGSTGGFEIQDVILDGLSYIWAVDGSYGWKASAYVGGTNHATESWIVSPQINLSRAISPNMQFETAINYMNGHQAEEFCTVLVSTNYAGDVTKAKWEELSVSGWPTTSSWTFYPVNLIDLSQYNGSRIHMAFRYVSLTDAAPTWEVKNLKIAEIEEFQGGGDAEGGDTSEAE